MRKLMILALLAACGGEEAPARPPQRAGGGAAGAAAPTPAAMPAKSQPTQQLSLRAKVDKQYRKELTQSDFIPDTTGEINRDPFRSYLVSPPPLGGQTAGQGDTADECENRTVAEKASFGELKLIGIVTRGTRNFAMFKDAQQVGQIAYQGDCVSKEKARILEITPGCVRLEVRAEAPPGAPAPPPREDKVCLHPEDIEIQ